MKNESYDHFTVVDFGSILDIFSEKRDFKSFFGKHMSILVFLAFSAFFDNAIRYQV